MNFRRLRTVLTGLSLIALLLIAVIKNTTILQKALISNYYRITGVALFEGNGSKALPYKIYAPEQLLWIDDSLSKEEHFYDKYFVLAEDMQLSGEYASIAIGSLTDGTSFGGTIEGNGHCISGLENSYGLFEVLGGTVTNLIIKNCKIEGDGAGSIAAVLGNSGRIINCMGQENLPIAGVCYGNIINSVTGDVIELGDVSNTPNYAYPREDEIFADFDEPLVKHCIINRNGQYMVYDQNAECSQAKAAEYLSNNFGYMNPDLRLRCWIEDDSISPAGDYSEVVDRVYMTFKRGGVDTVLDAFYSIYDEAWCFALPFAVDGDFDITVVQGASGMKLLAENSCEEKNFEYKGNNYRVLFFACDDIPTLFMDSDDGQGVKYLYSDKQNALSGSLTVFDDKGEELSKTTVKSISGRGNDSYSQDKNRKNSYAVELRGKASILGLPENDDFVLTSGFRFTSLYSYMFERDLMRSMQIPYVMDYRTVNLYIDNEYQGMYLVTGSQEISPDRFDLKNLYEETKNVNGRALKSYEKREWMDEDSLASRVWYDIPVNPEDITGGYLLELDLKDYPESRSRFTTDLGMSVTLKSNNYASKAQVDYVASMVQDFEDAVMSEDGYNKKGIYYADYIDMESFADELLMFELGQDTSMSGSFYFYKDSDSRGDGKLHGAGHWDIERSFIEKEKLEADFSWVFGERHNYMKRTKMQCIGALGTHNDFLEVMRQEWKNKFLPALKNVIDGESGDMEEGALAPIKYYEKYSKADRANHSRWYRCDGELKAKDMQQYLNKRINTMNRYFERTAEDMRSVDEAFWKK